MRLKQGKRHLFIFPHKKSRGHVCYGTPTPPLETSRTLISPEKKPLPFAYVFLFTYFYEVN